MALHCNDLVTAEVRLGGGTAADLGRVGFGQRVVK